MFKISLNWRHHRKNNTNLLKINHDISDRTVSMNTIVNIVYGEVSAY